SALLSHGATLRSAATLAADEDPEGSLHHGREAHTGASRLALYAVRADCRRRGQQDRAAPGPSSLPVHHGALVVARRSSEYHVLLRKGNALHSRIGYDS